MSGTIFVRHERCVACKRCRFACILAHSRSGELVAAVAERPRPAARIAIGPAGRHVVPAACRHCDAAACLLACPSGAIRRDGVHEPVVLAPERCVGCQDCVLACPYGVPRVTADRAAVVKCDLCVERLGRGEVPACVDACPTGALAFRWTRDAVKELERPPARTIVERPAVETTGDAA